MPREYEVGYGKPPEHGRFKKGQSGNPAGRPKSTKNLQTDLQEELSAEILVSEGHHKRRISKQRAVVKSLLNNAIRGDSRATTTLFQLMLRVLDPDAEGLGDQPLSGEERDVIQGLLKRSGMMPETGEE